MANSEYVYIHRMPSPNLVPLRLLGNVISPISLLPRSLSSQKENTCILVVILKPKRTEMNFNTSDISE
jgi:hypothetical protein